MSRSNIWSRGDIDTHIKLLREIRNADGQALAAGRVPGSSVVHKFGFSGSVSTTFAPLTSINDYQMPQVAGATTLRVAAGGNAADDAAGAGAREITFEGLSTTGAPITEAVATAGASASSATSASFLRLFRAWVSASGAYADGHTTFSHAAAITIENSGGGTNWAQILHTPGALGQTQISAYSVPLGKTAYIRSVFLNVDSSKAVDFRLMQRRSILDAAAPYSAWRLVDQQPGVTGTMPMSPHAPLGPFPALTDLVFLARVATGNGSASADFEIVLEDAA